MFLDYTYWPYCRYLFLIIIITSNCYWSIIWICDIVHIDSCNIESHLPLNILRSVTQRVKNI